MKIVATLLISLALIVNLNSCTSDEIDTNSSAPSTQVAAESSPIINNNDLSLRIASLYDKSDLDISVQSYTMSYVAFKGDSIKFQGDGAVVDGSKITITKAGMYCLSGTLNDGQVIVDTEDEGIVKLVLNGVKVTCTTSSPINIINAKKTVITLVEGTTNQVVDGTSYVITGAESDQPDAAIFSRDDLTINGKGTLNIDANYNHGIVSRDDLKIMNGNLNIIAVNDGMRGKDCIAINNGNIIVNAGGDGMQSNNNEDAEKGFIVVENGKLNITAGMDGIQAETDLMVTGGDITISSGGGSLSVSNENKPGNPGVAATDNSTGSSAKGLKAGMTLVIEDGTINIDSSDDAVHSNDSLAINGGKIVLASGDDGLHSESKLEINGGDINITKSGEGIESSIVTINDGRIHLVASDDGINCAGAEDVILPGGAPNQNGVGLSGNSCLNIHGGYIVSNAGGDGIDVNGSIYMTAGQLIVNGPTNNGNGPLDYYNEFKITGGYLLAVGSSGMAQATSTSSTQYSIMVNFTSQLPANTMVHVETEDGLDILTFVPLKAYQSIVFSSPQLKKGSTYRVYAGGNSTGVATDGLYSGEKYNAGTQIVSLTISNMLTTSGTTGNGGGFPGGGGSPGNRRR